MSSFDPSLRQQQVAVMNFLWSEFLLCKGIIDFFCWCQLLAASFSSQHIHVLQTSSTFLKSPYLLLMDDVQHLVEPGVWTTSSDTPDLRFFSLMKMPVREPGEILYGQSLRGNFLPHFVGLCCFCNLFPGIFRGQFYCLEFPCCNAVNRHNQAH